MFVNWGQIEQSAGVGGEEGQGLSRASCWLQEETDPGEAMTPVVFSLLPPATHPDWANSKAAITCYTLGHTF